MDKKLFFFFWGGGGLNRVKLESIPQVIIYTDFEMSMCSGSPCKRNFKLFTPTSKLLHELYNEPSLSSFGALIATLQSGKHVAAFLRHSVS